MRIYTPQLSDAFHIRLHLFRRQTDGGQKKVVCVMLESDSDDEKWGHTRGSDDKWLMKQHLAMKRRRPFPFFPAASVAGASHNSQDVEENVDDVSVEVEGGKDVLLWAQ